MDKVPLLSLILWLPVVGMVFILLTPKEQVRLIRFWAHLFTGAVLVLSLGLWFGFGPELHGVMQFEERHNWVPILGISYHLGVDGLSMPLVVLTALLTFLSVVYSPTAIHHREKEYYALFLMLETGMVGVFVALDFVLFYVFWEVSLVPMYFLIGIWGGPRREYAAIKFFLYTLLGSVAMLLSILVLYFHGGTFNMLELIEKRPLAKESVTLQALVWLGFYLAFAIKVPVFPFHTWLPDAHVEAPTAGSVILAGILLKMGTYGLVRINLPMLPEASDVFWGAMGVLALVNILYGSLVAMAQDDLKKLIAYSSIGHMGFVMLGVAAAAKDGMAFADAATRSAKVMALNGATWTMIAHGLMTGAMFLLVGVIYERAHHRDLNRFGGLWARMPVYGSLFSFFAMAELGLPGLAGFWGEFFSVLGAFKVFNWAGFAVIGIVITAAYFLWTIQRMFLGEPKDEYRNFPDMNLQEHLSLWPLVVLTFFVGVYPTFLLRVIQPAMEQVVETMTRAYGL
ncbi:NADH-quinone oxidoreductase subunit M [bacterium HR17]|uniref:NADH-quinone oxidoreductase subunit M n=1 Tax=Candidatus Fervidibacter japonicus TaxID=2035412 RepID=A0A2H5XGC8_9BACT|nr:NADH-quinone oxidoreductase subunit M [bacterium HR17]